MGQIEKQYGKGAVMRMGDNMSLGIEAISTGALSLDIALGIGGLPRGRVVEIYGPESSGKSTLAMHAVAEAQRNGGICAYVDAEHAMDPVYARAIGVNVDDLLISQPDTGEQALEIADMLIRSGALDIIVIDSVAALTPRAEIEGDMGDSHVGLQARLMSQALRKLTATLNRSNTICIFINQLREKIGVLFGSPETTPGGRALKFYSSIRLDIRRIESIKDGAEVTGNRTRVKVVKNKCVAAGTMIFDPTTGLSRPIEDVVATHTPSSVVAVDKLGALHARPVVQRFDQGEAEVIALELGDGAMVWVTPDHKIMTDMGWRPAGDLGVGDRVARPRRFGGFGDQEPVSPSEARQIGHLVGDAQPVGKLTLLRPDLHDSLRAQRIPTPLFGAEVSEEVLANLVLGLFESGGWVTQESTGERSVGYATTSEQLAHQLHWLMLRWGVTSSVGRLVPLVAGTPGTSGMPERWEVRIGDRDDVGRLVEAIPTWRPGDRVVADELATHHPNTHHGSSPGDLPVTQIEPVLAHLRGLGVTAPQAASLMGPGAGDPGGGLGHVLGAARLRRDGVERLADALDSAFLHEVLSEEVWYDEITVVHPAQWSDIYDVEVDEHHSFVANDVVVSNCSPPFRQAEFDIMYGKGISREGTLLDVAVEKDIVKKSGAWYTYQGEQLGQGRENAKAFLADNLELMIEISEKVRQIVGLGGVRADDVIGADPADDVPITLDD